MNKQNKIIVGVVALILALTVGYAVFSQSLNIGGTAKASGSLNIVFKEVGEIVYQGANETTTTEITENGKKLVIEGTELNYPTAYVDIPVTIVNNGTVDGILESITVENLETDDIKVSIKGVEKDQVVKVYNSNDDTTIVNATVRIEWLDKTDTKVESTKQIVVRLNARQLLKSDVTTTSGGSAANNCTAFTKKDTYSVGNVISFCNENTGKSEDFYVISDNGETVTALAKYSLLVGNSFDLTSGSTTPIPTDTKDYGLQSEKTVFTADGDGNFSDTVFYGSLNFAESEYWEDDSGKLLSKYENLGTDENYIAYVYDENSLMYAPIQNYNEYIKNTLNKKSVVSRLITEVEIENLGCDSDSSDIACKNAPDWVSSTMYASGTYDSGIVGVTGKDGYSSLGATNNPFGVRPVITINKSEI